jgi:hypothetical protein
VNFGPLVAFALQSTAFFFEFVFRFLIDSYEMGNINLWWFLSLAMWVFHLVSLSTSINSLVALEKKATSAPP